MTQVSIPEGDVRPFDMGPLPGGRPLLPFALASVAALAAVASVPLASLPNAGSVPKPAALAQAVAPAEALVEDAVRIDAALLSPERISAPVVRVASASVAVSPPIAASVIPLPPARLASAVVTPASAAPPSPGLAGRVDDAEGLPAMFRVPSLPAGVLGYAAQPTYAARAANVVPSSIPGQEAANETPGLFDRLLGAFKSLVTPAAPTPTISTNYDGMTAVYDITAHTVYLPDGTTLEAHSGLGAMFDDPRYVHARNRGSTPPHLYDMTLRERSFHGVQAIRLNPVGPGNVYGRNGLLAHTFMLGRKGESNGCVSFKDYKPFLTAFRNGQIRRLAVVERMAG